MAAFPSSYQSYLSPYPFPTPHPHTSLQAVLSVQSQQPDQAGRKPAGPWTPLLYGAGLQLQSSPEMHLLPASATKWTQLEQCAMCPASWELQRQGNRV